MPLYRLTLGQYERMVDEGILGDHDRVHLINGILVAKMTRNDPHCAADDLCDDALRRIIPAGWYIRGAKPVRIPGQAGRRDSKPEPDRLPGSCRSSSISVFCGRMSILFLRKNSPSLWARRHWVCTRVSLGGCSRPSCSSRSHGYSITSA
jgi:hypothetical protein